MLNGGGKNTTQTANQLISNALELQNIPGDDHCLYHAVALYLGVDQQRLRNHVADEIEKNPHKYKDFITRTDTQTPEQGLKAYAEAVRSKRVWADNLEIAILMRLLNRPIVVIDGQGKIRNKKDFETYKDEINPIFVRYNNTNHYDALLLKDAYRNKSKEFLAELLEHESPSVILTPGSTVNPDPSANVSGGAKQDANSQHDSKASLSSPPKQKGKFDSRKSLLQVIKENPELFQDWQQVATKDETLRFQKNYLEIIVTPNKISGICKNNKERAEMYDKMAEAMALAGHKSVTLNVNDKDPQKFALLVDACKRYGMTVLNKETSKEQKPQDVKENVANVNSPIIDEEPRRNMLDVD